GGVVMSSLALVMYPKSYTMTIRGATVLPVPATTTETSPPSPDTDVTTPSGSSHGDLGGHLERWHHPAGAAPRRRRHDRRHHGRVVRLLHLLLGGRARAADPVLRGPQRRRRHDRRVPHRRHQLPVPTVRCVHRRAPRRPLRPP